MRKNLCNAVCCYVLVMLSMCPQLFAQKQITTGTDTLLIEDITKDEGNTFYNVSFVHSQMLLHLPLAKYRQFKSAEKAAITKLAPVPAKVTFDLATGEIIEMRELKLSKKSFFKLYGLPNADTSKSLQFNISEQNQKRLNLKRDFNKSETQPLTETIPTENLQKIFKLISEKSCTINSPSTAGEGYCIPFEYARDGCFARAQVMKDIFEDQYHFKTQKIFTDRLSRRQGLGVNKHGWCINACIYWSFHVTVLLQEKKADGSVVSTVVDPSLFDHPVTVDEWVNKQKECGGRVVGPTIKTSNYYFEDHIYDPSVDNAYTDMQKYLDRLKKECSHH